MGQSIPVNLSTRNFKTQSEAKTFFKTILNRYAPGDRLSNEDSLEISALLERHPEYKEKLGVGISYFEIMVSPEHGTHCFRLVRTDGSGTDFSYLHAISGKPPSRKQEVNEALRNAVRFDLYKARDKFFVNHVRSDGKYECAVSGEFIGRDQGHIDHRPPMTFEVIAMAFLIARGITVDEVPLSNAVDEQVSAEIPNVALCNAFRDFHRDVAVLDFVKKVSIFLSLQNFGLRKAE